MVVLAAQLQVPVEVFRITRRFVRPGGGLDVVLDQGVRAKSSKIFPT